MAHAAKRQRHGGSSEKPRRVVVDESLYRSNHEAANSLRCRILVKLDGERFVLPPCQFRRIAMFKPVDVQPARPTPQSGRYESQCPWCEASNRPSLQLSHSKTILLTLEQQRYAILYDQLVLAPMQHVQSTLYLDDVAYTELRNYQKTLVQMFHEQQKAVLFVEISLRDPYLQNKDSGQIRRNQHSRIECFPVPLDALQVAKSYFKKAITDLVPEWAQNRKVITVTGKTGVRGSIPKGYDFVHVDYSLSGDGLACVIEDATKVPPSFSREVVAGILEMDTMERAFRSNDKYAQAFSWLRNQYKNFDWTNIT